MTSINPSTTASTKKSITFNPVTSLTRETDKPVMTTLISTAKTTSTKLPEKIPETKPSSNGLFIFLIVLSSIILISLVAYLVYIMFLKSSFLE